jgi:hypothetical protein
MPSRLPLWAGFVGGVASTAIFGWLAHEPHRELAFAPIWFLMAVSILIALGSGLRLLLQLPIIEASELGIAVWLYGPYRRPFFAPWSHVRAVVVTQVRGAKAARASAPRDALGIELVQGDRVRLPRSPVNDELPIDGAAPADLAWSRRLISGNIRRWVDLLQTMKRVCEQSPTR